MANRSFSSISISLKSLTILFVFGAIALGGCRKSDRDDDTHMEFTRSFWSNTNKVHHVLRQIHGVAIVDSLINGNGNSSIVSEVCFDSVTYLDSNMGLPIFPNQLNIHFSETVVCENTRIQSGSILTTFSGPYEQVGTQIDVSFDNYRTDDIEIQGNMTMTLYKNKFDSLAFNVTFDNLTFIDHDKAALNISHLTGTIQWVRWIGNSTPEATDDDFTISAVGQGMAYNGVIYNYESELPVLFFAECNFESSGSYVLSTPNSADRICNFGDGTCDNKMLVTIEPGVADTEVEIN